MKALSVITYLLYTIFWESLTIGGCAYLVFWKDQSAWWFVLAAYLSFSQTSTTSWRKLWDDTPDKPASTEAKETA